MREGSEASATVVEEEGTLRITVPARHRWWSLGCFYGYFVLLLWAACLLVMIGDLPRRGPDPVGALIVVAVTLFAWLWAMIVGWNLRGRDVLTADDAGLAAEKPLLLYRPRRVFAREDIQDLYASEAVRSPVGFFGPRHFTEDVGVTGGRLVIEVRGRKYRYGTGIGFEEAEHLASLLRRQLHLHGEGGLAPLETAETRVVVNDTGDTLTITIPARQRRLGRVLFVVWLVFWNPVLFAVTAGRSLWNGGDPIPLRVAMGVGIVVLLPALCLLGWMIFWEAFGREEVRLDREWLELVRRAGPFRRTRHFARAEIHHAQAWRETVSREGSLGRIAPGDYLAFGGGHVTFEYEGRRYPFGVGLDYAEAHRIAGIVRHGISALGGEE